MGTIGLQRGVQNLLIGAGAKTFGKVLLWTCESRALFQGGSQGGQFWTDSIRKRPHAWFDRGASSTRLGLV